MGPGLGQGDCSSSGGGGVHACAGRWPGGGGPSRKAPWEWTVTDRLAGAGGDPVVTDGLVGAGGDPAVTDDFVGAGGDPTNTRVEHCTHGAAAVPA